MPFPPRTSAPVPAMAEMILREGGILEEGIFKSITTSDGIQVGDRENTA